MTTMNVKNQVKLPSFQELTLQLGREKLDDVPRSEFVHTEMTKELPAVIQRSNNNMNIYMDRGLIPAVNRLNECLKSCGAWLQRINGLGIDLQNCYQNKSMTSNSLLGQTNDDYINVIELNHFLNNLSFDVLEDDVHQLFNIIRATRFLAAKSYIYSELMEKSMKNPREFVDQTKKDGSFTYTTSQVDEKAESSDDSDPINKITEICNHHQNQNTPALRKLKPKFNQHRRTYSSPIQQSSGKRECGFKRRTSSLSSPELHQLLVFCQSANQNDDISKVLDLEVDPQKVAPNVSSIKKIENPSSSSSGGLNTLLSLPARVLKCYHCETKNSPEWRKGPEGKQTLCNACGLFYAKLSRKYGLKKAASLLLQKAIARNLKNSRQ